eukprot:scaffold27566_cov44-Prasinocladus_malaysianus.AAC.1
MVKGATHKRRVQACCFDAMKGVVACVHKMIKKSWLLVCPTGTLNLMARAAEQRLWLGSPASSLFLKSICQS